MPLLSYPAWVIGVFYGVLGLVGGALAARYTYCVVIATHQAMGVRYSRVYEMILTGVAVSALGVGVLTAAGAVPFVDAYHFMPGAGWYTFVGAFIFGFGIMLGNGCMFGMLWKSGVGYVVNWLEILGMMLGTYIFAYPVFEGLRLGWWWHTTTFMSIANGNPLNFVPYLLGDSRAAALGVGALFFAGIMAAALWMRRNRLQFEVGRGKIYNSPYFIGTLFGLLMLASFVFAAGHFFNYLGVTTPVGLFTEYLLYPFGVDLARGGADWYATVPVISAFTFFILMVILGAYLYSTATGTFSVRLPSRTTNRAAEAAIAFAGGVILAIGARMAQGCSVGGFWSGLTGLSLFGLVFTLGFIPGTIAGYYAYVGLSSWAASLKRSAVSSSRWDDWLSRHSRALNLLFGVALGLVLIGIALELPGLNAGAARAIKAPVLAQYQAVLLGWGAFAIAAALAVWGARNYLLRR